MTERFIKLMRFLEDSPSDAFLLFAVAKEYEQQGDDANALSYYAKVCDADVHYVGVYYHLGKLYERLGQPTLAVQTYEKGIDVAKKLGESHAAAELAAALLPLTEEY